jgi:hypothetical protein
MTCPAERMSGPCISLIKRTWDESQSSRRLAGARGGVGGGETFVAECLKFGRDGQFVGLSFVWVHDGGIRAPALGTPLGPGIVVASLVYQVGNLSK